MQKRKCTEKTTNQIKSFDGHIANDNTTLSNAFEFFQRLYCKEDNVRKASLSEVFQNVDLSHLNVEMATNLDTPVIMMDIMEAVNNMRHNKSSGMDGFTIIFGEDISAFILCALIYPSILAVCLLSGGMVLLF